MSKVIKPITDKEAIEYKNISIKQSEMIKMYMESNAEQMNLIQMYRKQNDKLMEMIKEVISVHEKTTNTQ